MGDPHTASSLICELSDYFVLSCREDQSLAEGEQKEEIEEPTIEEPGKGHTLLLQFIFISFELTVSSNQKKFSCKESQSW